MFAGLDIKLVKKCGHCFLIIDSLTSLLCCTFGKKRNRDEDVEMGKKKDEVGRLF